MNDTVIHKGLAGVVVDTTDISMVDPVSNSLLYRGYPAEELAERCSIEQVAYLLWHGDLPTAEQLAEFMRQGRAGRTLPAVLSDILDQLPLDCHPMDVCRTAASVLGTLDPDPQDTGAEAQRRRANVLFAAMPTVIAADQRRRRGQDILAPRPDLGFVDNFLYMSFGTIPDPIVVRAFEVSLVMYAEHSFNASTFAARVITSTLSDMYSAVTGAIGALKGPLHGGANEAVMDTFEEIGAAQNVGPWLEQTLGAHRKVMGFGHRVYKNGDSRVPVTKRYLDELVKYYDRPEIGQLYDALEAAMLESTGIRPNLDYVTGPMYHLMGFETKLFTPLFVAARIIGWTAHVIEQESANSLIRPLAEYRGPDLRHVPAEVAVR